MRQLFCEDTGFVCDKNELFTRLNHREELFERACELLEELQGEIRPCYIARELPVTVNQSDRFSIEDEVFRSKIAALKLSEQKNAFVFIASSGRGVDDRLDKEEDPLDKSLIDIIAYMAYLKASTAMSAALEAEYGMQRHLRLCPGSIIDWSVGDNRFFFPLLDGLWQPLNLRVLDSGLIVPLKSSAGVLYETTDEFESCAICPRPNCPSRTLPFDLDLHEQMGNL